MERTGEWVFFASLSETISVDATDSDYKMKVYMKL